MATAAARENSVLMSLRELRAIEDARTAEERAAVEREAAEQRRLERDLVLAQEAAAEARVQAQAEAQRIAAAAAAAAARESELRLREVEIQARTQAAAALDAERLAHEVALRRLEIERTRPRSMYALVGACAIAIVGLAVLFVMRDRALDERADRLAALTAQNAATRAALDKATQDRDTIVGVLATMRDRAMAPAPPPVVARPPVQVEPRPRPRPPHPPTGGGTGSAGAGSGTAGTIHLGDCVNTPLGCADR
jgi:hypothetical protein